MCGIVGIFKIKSQSEELRNKALRMAQKIRHRGPDWSGIYTGGSAILAHERLSIVEDNPFTLPTVNKFLPLTAKSIITVKYVPGMPDAMNSGQVVTAKSFWHFTRTKAFISSKS